MSKKTNTPIRVLQVVTVMNRAGLETMLMNYYRAIDRTKVQFDFLVHRAERGDYDDEIEKLGGKIYRFSPMTIRSMLGYRKKIKNFLLEHPEYKVVHSHIDALSALPLSGAKDADVPTRIAHSHNTNFSIDIKYPIRVLMKKITPRYATSLFACAQDAGKFMFGKTAKFTIINNAINVKDFIFDNATRSTKRQAMELDNKLVIGNIGRFMHQKNHSFLVDVFAEIRQNHDNAVLLLIGNGGGRSAIKEKVRTLGLEKDVLFLGVRTDIPELLQAMDIFLMPSLYEGLPVVSIEAQASGLLCVFSDTITRSLDVTGNCYFISLSASPKEWSGQVLSLVDTHDRSSVYEQISNAGYSCSDEARKLAEYYREKSV